jgi:hypothetical protein
LRKYKFHQPFFLLYCHHVMHYSSIALLVSKTGTDMAFYLFRYLPTLSVWVKKNLSLLRNKFCIRTQEKAQLRAGDAADTAVGEQERSNMYRQRKKHVRSTLEVIEEGEGCR